MQEISSLLVALFCVMLVYEKSSILERLCDSSTANAELVKALGADIGRTNRWPCERPPGIGLPSSRPERQYQALEGKGYRVACRRMR